MIVITPTNTFGIYKLVTVTEAGLLCDNSFLPFTVIGMTYEISENDSLMPTNPNPTKPIPPIAVTMRQARLALLQVGKLSTVNNAIASMTGAQGEAARIEWEFSSEVKRDQPLTKALAPVLGMTETDLDQLFIAAAKL